MQRLRCPALVWFLQTALYFTTLPGEPSLPCAVFEFPTIKNGTISAQEHTKLAFLFELQNDHCGEELLSNFSVVVRKLTNDKTMFSTHCSMKHINGACIKALNTNPGCICLTKTGQHLFQKIVDRNDSTTWVWSTSGNLAEKKEVSFNIEYAPNVKDIISRDAGSSSIPDENATVEIVCLWDSGNPPVKARLLDRHGVELEGGIYGSGQIRSTFPAVSCEDAGLIRCEAPGANTNKTFPLLVKCPPILSFSHDTAVLRGKTTELKVDVHSHTSDMKCMLAESSNLPLQHCSQISVTGTPPNLTLTVQLDIVRKEEGQWRLELTNDAGSGHMDFRVQTKTSDDNQIVVLIDARRDDSTTADISYNPNSSLTTITTITDKEDGSVWAFIAGDRSLTIGAIVCAGVVFGVIVTVCVIVIRRGKRATVYEPAAEPDDDVPACRNRRATRDSMCSTQSRHIYDEASEDPIQLQEAMPRTPRPTPRVQRAIPPVPDKCVNAVTSSWENFEEGDEAYLEASSSGLTCANE